MGEALPRKKGERAARRRRVRAPYSWAPQRGPQHTALHCPYDEIFFGGARGGGKSDAALGRAGFRAGLYGKHYNGVIFRIELPQADDLIERAQELYGDVARYNQQRMAFRFANGARIRFRPLKTVADAAKYQGQNLTDALIEEVGNYPFPDPILRLFGALRSSGGVPTSLFMTGNPGGPGQQWVAERYVFPAPGGLVPLVRRFEGVTHRAIYIPSRLTDNQILMRADPRYIAKLHLVGSAALVKAWLEGDWGAIEGAFFDVWNAGRHVTPPQELPAHWMKFRSVDWGSARPFSVGWWAVASEPLRLRNGCTLPRGGMIRYREWYGKKSANVGLKMTAEEVARGIKARTPEGEKIAYTVVDPAMFSEDGGPSLAERFGDEGVPCVRADNKRTRGAGAMGGWDQLRARMKGHADDEPGIVTFDTNADSIRTLPVLQHDPVNAEDLDTDGEDHAADEWRYAAMSRPWAATPRRGYDPLRAARKPLTFDQAVKAAELAARSKRKARI